MRNRIFQESRARECQDMQQERNPSTVSQLLTLIQVLQNKVNSLTNERELHDLDTASSSGASHVPSQPLKNQSPRGMLSRDSGLPLDTRNSMGTSGNVFVSLLARDGLSSAFFKKSKNIASSSCGLGSGNSTEHEKEGETRSSEFFNANPTF